MTDNFYPLLKSIYTKKKIDVGVIDQSTCIRLLTWLSYDADNLAVLKHIAEYLFFVTPLHFYYILYLTVPQKARAPFLKKVENDSTETSRIFIVIQKYFGWSNRVLKLHLSILGNLPNMDLLALFGLK